LPSIIIKNGFYPTCERDFGAGLRGGCRLADASLGTVRKVFARGDCGAGEDVTVEPAVVALEVRAEAGVVEAVIGHLEPAAGVLGRPRQLTADVQELFARSGGAFYGVLQSVVEFVVS